MMTGMTWQYGRRARMRGNANLFVMLGLLVFAILFIGGAWFLSGLGPGKAGRNQRKGSEVDARLEADVAALLSTRIRVRSWPSQDAAELDAEQEQVLRKAVQLVDAVASRKNLLTNDELAAVEELEGLSTALLAGHLQAVSRRLEAEGTSLIEASRTAEGLEALALAMERQAEVNTSFPSSRFVDRKRLFLLERKIKEQQSERLHQASVQAEEEGDQQLADGNWRAAAGHFQEAFAKQVEINEQHAKSRRRDPLRLQALQSKKVHAESYDAIAALEGQAAQAHALEQQSEFLEAARAYQKVADRISVLQKEKPDLAPVLKLRQAALVAAVARAAAEHFRGHFKNQLAQLDRHLAMGRMVEALRLEAALRVQLEEMGRRYPEAVPFFAQEQDRLQFLQRRQARAAAQQQYLRQQFAPIPGHAGWWMLRTEVSQDLFSALMDVQNPSRSQGGGLPVESVSHADAVTFSKRVSWLLGVPAQLPSRAHFDAAAGKPASVADIPIQPSASTVVVGSGPAGPGGFFHIWGNVSEWLALEDGAAQGEASHAGGHFLDNAAGLLQNPVRTTTANDRNRLIGFRIVIHNP